MTSSGKKNIPISPVHTLPLSTTSTASGSVVTTPAITAARITSEWVSCHTASRKVSG
ncbi:hypothetical protein C1Y40_05472 [Mycobacterium talmoniae]|uniref:Uncharacterized protein n=1 Tax=Mycobacterium talmoniae TaxID=1858794 RepID=A0A2S8BCH9_9MYCO|nr:hypothetical protein C1Y40_05472 [Mycobacterium talmoniae]